MQSMDPFPPVGRVGRKMDDGPHRSLDYEKAMAGTSRLRSK